VGQDFTSIDVPFSGATGNFATGINNKGEIVGHYTDNIGGQHAFILSKGQFTQWMPRFRDVTVTSTTGWRINDLGEVVGSYTSISALTRSFLAKPQ
jgi:probable HAF family extracellular repeat protein